jgi:hypothetical protein
VHLISRHVSRHIPLFVEWVGVCAKDGLDDAVERNRMM